MFAGLTKRIKWQQPIIWALLAALLLHLLLLLMAASSKEVSLEQSYSQATEVVLYDLEEPPIELAPLAPEPLEPQPVEPPPVPPVNQQLPDKPEEAVQPEKRVEIPIETPINSPVEPPKPAVLAPAPRLSGSLIARSLEIARLEAELAAMQTSYAQQPRVRRISSGAKMSSEEALYLRQWEERVERIGNLNYPEAARSQNLGGRLRLMVVIAADGRILEAQLLTGSGHSLLDDAALRILNLAAPFAPLPESIRAEADVLEIIRTWQFGDGWYAN